MANAINDSVAMISINAHCRRPHGHASIMPVCFNYGYASMALVD